jgi:hypothetical protein
MTRIGAPSVLDDPSEVKALLSEAEDARVLAISRRELVRADCAGRSLLDTLRELGRHADDSAGKGSLEILGDAPVGDLGHAPSWIDAGGVYEDLVAHGPEQGDIIFCLDPWAAQLIRDDDSASGARWFVVSDVNVRKPASHEDYWAQLEEWLERRPFAGIISREAWEEALGSRAVPSVHLQRPGAWQWKTMGGTAEPSGAGTQALLFLVKYSGSLPHLRVFLDSLARQDHPRERLRATILISEESEDLRRYLRWHALAHPTLAVEALVMSPSETDANAELNRSLEAFPGALVVMTGDHTILPSGFSRVALEMSAARVLPSLPGLPLSAEASAHAVTGNLDAVAHYESLAAAFSRAPESAAEDAVRLVPAEAWRGGDLGPVANIMAYVRETGHAAVGGPALLQLGDLP